MSEQAPTTAPEVAPEASEALLPRDEAIDAARNEMATLNEYVSDEKNIARIEAKAETPGFKADANEVLAAKLARRDLHTDLDSKKKELDALKKDWTELGGDAVDAAEQAVSELNFKSDAHDRVQAKTALRDAKNNYYANLQAREAAKNKVETKPEVAEDEKTVDESDPAAKMREAIKAMENLTMADILRNGLSDEENLKLFGDLLKARTRMQAELQGHEKSLKASEEKGKADESTSDDEGDQAKADAARDARYKEYGAENIAAAEELAYAEGRQKSGKNETSQVDYDNSRELAEIYNYEWDQDHATDPEQPIRDPRVGDRATMDGFVEGAKTLENNRDKKYTWLDKLRTKGDKYKAKGYGLLFEKKSGKTRKGLILGALGVVAGVAGYMALKNGTSHHDTLQALTPDQHIGGGHEFVPPTHHVDPSTIEITANHLPTSDGFEYPWDWAAKAFGAEHAMSHLEELGAKAAELGHKVEWHGSGTHRWMEIDGNSETKFVIDTLRPLGK